MKIILFQPQIPQNTGNVVRTCNVTGASLGIVTPMGFSTSDRLLKRAGLDYWNEVDIEYIENLEEYLERTSCPFFFFSSHARKSHVEVSFPENSLLIFGSETSGLPPQFKERWPDQFCKIPMKPNTRCLNLATSVGIGLYEALRQNSFLSVS